MTIQQEKCKDREVYEAPEAEILELTAEGIVCASGGAYRQWEEEDI